MTVVNIAACVRYAAEKRVCPGKIILIQNKERRLKNGKNIVDKGAEMRA